MKKGDVNFESDDWRNLGTAIGKRFCAGGRKGRLG